MFSVRSGLGEKGRDEEMLSAIPEVLEHAGDLTAGLTPAVLATGFSVFAIGAALLAVASSHSDTPREKHTVLVASVIAAGSSLLLSILVRPVIGGLLVESPAPPLLHRVWLPGLAVGLTVFAGLQVGGFLLVHRAKRRAFAPSEDLVRAARKAAAEMGLRRTPAVLLSANTQSPYVTLLGRGTIMLPADFESEPYPVQRGVLMHEVAHIRRGDCWTHLVCQLCGVLLWWNPFYWIAMRRVILERELACDAAVLAGHNDVVWYAGVLSRFAQRAMSVSSIAFASAPMATKSTLRSRLESLDPMLYRWCHLDLRFEPMTRGRMIAWVVLIVVAVLTFECVAPTVVADEGFNEWVESISEPTL